MQHHFVNCWLMITLTLKENACCLYMKNNLVVSSFIHKIKSTNAMSALDIIISQLLLIYLRVTHGAL